MTSLMTRRPVTRRLAIVAMLACVCLLSAFSVFAEPVKEFPAVVNVAIESRQQASELSERFDVWAVPDGEHAVIYLRDVSAYDRLLESGLPVVLDRKATNQVMQAQHRMAPASTRSIAGFSCYRTVEEAYASVANLVATFPLLAELVDIGDSWEKINLTDAGHDLQVLKLTRQSTPGPKPKLFAMGSIHARELAPAELVTRFAEYLVLNYDVDPDVTWLLDHHEIHLITHGNPDGRKQAERGDLWRKTTNQDYCGATSDDRGADMNRNFPFEWGGLGASTSQCSDIYRGPTPESEPETLAITDYVRSIFPDARPDDLNTPAPDDTAGVYIDVHSFGELVLWPWGYGDAFAPNHDALAQLGQRFAFFNGYLPQRSAELYSASGASDDFAYGELGVAAYTFELGTDFFQDCNTFENDIAPDNLESLLYAARVARAPYLIPGGPNASIRALPSIVERGEPVVVTGTIDDSGFQGGGQTVHTIASADLFADQPPWDSGAVAQPMAADDGQFDQTAETVSLALDTSMLFQGRRMLFVQGEDSSGQAGPVSSAFLTVVFPGETWTLEGQVTDALSGDPVEATVVAEQNGGMADASGNYLLRFFDGRVDVTASAPGYFSATVEDILGTAPNQVIRDIQLQPQCSLFADDVETTDINWTTTGTWGRSTALSASPIFAWTDSPSGEYGNNSTTRLTSPVMDFTDNTSLTLEFAHVCDTEATYDFGIVEIFNGSSWSEVFRCDGQTQWQTESLDVSALAGIDNAQIRFTLDTDQSVTENGWTIDDITVLGSCGPQAVQPVLNIDSCSVDESAGSCPFVATLSSTATEAVTIQYSLASGTATAGIDFDATGGTATFMPGTTETFIFVPIVDDDDVESDENFQLQISEVTGADYTVPGAVTGTIVNDDEAPVTPVLTLSPGCSAAESDSVCQFNASLSSPATDTVQFDFATVAGTATAGADFSAGNGTITFANGTDSAVFEVNILGDLLDEPDETFEVAISNVVGADYTGATSLSGTIVDDDAAPQLAVADCSADEGDDCAFVISLSAVSGQLVSFSAATRADLDASSGDFVALANTGFTIPAGASMTTIDISTIDDSIDESSESFELVVSSVVNAVAPANAATGQINDNDGAPDLSATACRVNRPEAGTATCTVVVELNLASANAISVDYASRDISAVGQTDYQPVSGSLNFTPGETEKSFEVVVLPSAAAGYGMREFAIDFSNPVNANAPATMIGEIAERGIFRGGFEP